MPRPIALAVVLAVWGAVAAAAETTQPAKEPQATKEVKEAKDTAEPSLPPWTLKDWFRTSNLVQLRTMLRPQGEAQVPKEALYLDALREKTGWAAAFRRYPAYVDPAVLGEFIVEPAGIGTRAVGLIVGSTDSENYFALELTRTEAILYRAEAGKERVILGRRGISRPANVWHTASIECSGQLIRIYFNGRLLLVGESHDIKPGLIGAYAAHGRAEVILTGNGRPTRLAVPWELREPPTKPEPPKDAGKEPKKE